MLFDAECNRCRRLIRKEKEQRNGKDNENYPGNVRILWAHPKSDERRATKNQRNRDRQRHDHHGTSTVLVKHQQARRITYSFIAACGWGECTAHRANYLGDIAAERVGNCIEGYRRG